MGTVEIAGFGAAVAGALGRVLGGELVGTWFVGSIALGGFVPRQSDLDIVAVCADALTEHQKQQVASAVLEVSRACPARGLELTLYRSEAATAPPRGADFEVNVTGGPRMATAVYLDAAAEPGFWYVLDRAVAHRVGVVISGPPPGDVFDDIARRTLLAAMRESLEWHRVHEGATLYSVLNPCRAWRFAEEDVLVSKLAGAGWARERWPEPGVIDAAVALRRGTDGAPLPVPAVDDLLSAVVDRLLAAEG